MYYQQKNSLLNHVTWNTIAANHNADNSQCELTQWRIMHSCLSSSEISSLVLNLRNHLEYTSPCIIRKARLLRWWDRAWKISVRLLVKVHSHRPTPVTWALSLDCNSCVGRSCGRPPQQRWRHDACGVTLHSGVSPHTPSTAFRHLCQI